MSSSARRCQIASARSGPIPAGSPSVNANGRTILLWIVFSIDIRASCIRSWPHDANSPDSVWPARRISAGAFVRELPASPEYRIWFLSFRKSQTSELLRPLFPEGADAQARGGRGFRAIAALARFESRVG